MKSEVKIEELQKLMPSARSMLSLQIAGVQIFLAAFLFSGNEFISTLLFLIGAAALTESFEKTRLQHKIKEIMEQNKPFTA
jgi:hypothetical protein